MDTALGAALLESAPPRPDRRAGVRGDATRHQELGHHRPCERSAELTSAGCIRTKPAMNRSDGHEWHRGGTR